MLKDRILKTTSSISLPVPLAPLRPDKYKCWLDGRMEKAMAAVKDQGFSVRRAAEEYAIPKSTLHDRVSGRVLAGVCSGPPKYLTDEEEAELERYLTQCSSVGFARSRQQVIQLVRDGDHAQRFGCNGDTWVVGVLQEAAPKADIAHCSSCVLCQGNGK